MAAHFCTSEGQGDEPLGATRPRSAPEIFRVSAQTRELAAFIDAFVDEPKRHDFLVVAVVPAYNEDRFIGSVVLKAKLFVDHVIVIDDGSTDHTAAIATGAGALVLQHVTNRGKAGALRTGFSCACTMGADIVITLDGDGQHNPQEIPVVIRPILRDRADMVIGTRFKSTKNQIPVWRRAGQHALTKVTNLASGVPTSDSQSGFRAFSRRALKCLTLQSEGFAVESELQFWARKHELRVTEAPISCLYIEKSKRNPCYQALQVLGSVVELVSQSRPLFCYGAIGLSLSALGVAWWGWVVELLYQTRQLALRSFLLATLLVWLGMLLVFQGVTLYNLSRMAGSGPPPTKMSDRSDKDDSPEDA
jgi:glycosyltransferase involved in cell wall biosynthesis